MRSCLGGMTSLPNATVRRYFGTTSSKVCSAEISVSAGTTQQSAVTRCSFKNSTSGTGVINRRFGTSTTELPHTSADKISLRQASTYSGACMANTSVSQALSVFVICPA